MNKNRFTVQICTRDRHSEISLCLQSLRTQTFQDWDLILLDDASGNPITNCYFVMYLLNRIKLEGHKVKLVRNNISQGVCHARNQCIEFDDFNNEFSGRIDDDVVLESDYLEKMKKVFEEGYDLVSGITPNIETPELEREIKFVKPIINKHEFDKEGNLIEQKDDCGYGYIESEIIPTHQFRSNAFYKREIQEKVKYPTNLTTVGFREELFFSFKAILKGYKIGVHTGAKAYHFRCPSGGVRKSPEEYQKCVQLDDETAKKWAKKKFEEKGNFLK